MVPLGFLSVGGDFLSEQNSASAFSILNPFPITTPLPSFVIPPTFHHLPLFGCLSLLWQTQDTSSGSASLLQLNLCVPHFLPPSPPQTLSQSSPQVLSAFWGTTIQEGYKAIRECPKEGDEDGAGPWGEKLYEEKLGMLGPFSLENSRLRGHSLQLQIPCEGNRRGRCWSLLCGDHDRTQGHCWSCVGVVLVGYLKILRVGGHWNRFPGQGYSPSLAELKECLENTLGHMEWFLGLSFVKSVFRPVDSCGFLPTHTVLWFHDSWPPHWQCFLSSIFQFFNLSHAEICSLHTVCSVSDFPGSYRWF